MSTRHGTPSRDWLNPARGFLKTAAARAKVRHWFKQRDHDRHLAEGRATLERERRRLGLAEIDMAATARHFGLKTPHDLLTALGGGDLSPGQIEHWLSRPAPQPGPSTSGPSMERLRPAPAIPVEVLGINNLLTRFAGCCKPVPDDPIRGYITQGLDVSDAVTGEHIDILAVNTLSDRSTETAPA